MDKKEKKRKVKKEKKRIYIYNQKKIDKHGKKIKNKDRTDALEHPLRQYTMEIHQNEYTLEEMGYGGLGIGPDT